MTEPHKKPVISSVLHLQMLLPLSHSFQSLTFHQSPCNIHSNILIFLINIWQQHSDFKHSLQVSLGTEWAVNMYGHPVTSLKYVTCTGCILACLNSSSLETCSVSTIRINVYTHVNPVGGQRGNETNACTYILCALVKPSMLLPYWFAVIKQDGVINCLNPNKEALPSIETSLTIHSQQEISTNTTMKTSNLTKSFKIDAFQSTERTIYNLQPISIRLCWW